MSKYFLVFLFLTSSFGYAQLKLESNFSSVHIGRNQNLTVGYHFNKFFVYGGLKYNFNKRDNFPIATWFKKTSWATNVGEHFGGVIGMRYQFAKLEHISFFSFLEIQQSYTHVRHISEYILGSVVPEPTSDYDLIYQKQLYFVGPWWFIENNLGLGFSCNIWRGLSLNSKFGIGVLFYKNLDKQYIVYGPNNWNFSEMLSFGLGWKFDQKNTPE
ncbi:MAG: hypothetical protein IPO32_18025 [Crocinitomicaceae bacterium]|nr:hypothetical protein [Crocinitomicaceae bacterium]